MSILVHAIYVQFNYNFKCTRILTRYKCGTAQFKLNSNLNRDLIFKTRKNLVCQP